MLEGSTEFINEHRVVVLGVLCSILVLYSSGPLRALVFFRRNRIELLDGCSDLETVVLLIHGTFARNASWTTQRHDFQRVVRKAFGNCSVSRLLWSGDNSHRQRIAASEAVVDWIAQQSAKRIYLIGHSHGGGIAALAATKAADRRVFVVTLSTPFINISSRYPGFVRRQRDERPFAIDHRLFAGISLYIAVAGVLALRYFDDIDRIVKSLIFFPVFYAICLILFGIGQYASEAEMAPPRVARLIRRYANSLCEDARIDIPAHQMYILRVAADEASGFLAIGQFSSWMLFTLLKLGGRVIEPVVRAENCVRRVFATSEKLAWMMPFVIFLGIIFIPGIFGLVHRNLVLIALVAIVIYAALLYRIISILLEPSLIIIAGAVGFLLYLPFGIELAAASLLVSVSVESSPIGDWRVATVDPGQTLLSHSLLYESAALESLLKGAVNSSGVVMGRSGGETL